MKPGVYPGLANAKYHSTPAISVSGIKVFLRSPSHYQEYLNGDRIETKAFQMGTGLHAAVLEPDLFKFRYVRGPSCKRGSKDWSLFASRHIGREIMNPGEFDEIAGMSKAIRNHSLAGRLLSLDNGVTEESIFWIDPATGVLCRVRPDLRRLTWRDHRTGKTIVTLVDVKTTDDARPGPFKSTVKKYGYDIQAPFYMDGVATAHEADIYEFVFVAVEKKPPYGVVVHTLDDEMVWEGREKYRKALEKYAECEASQYWPGYEEKVNVIGSSKLAN